jgi:cobalt-zinc-cadmium resistance protein CzcA
MTWRNCAVGRRGASRAGRDARGASEVSVEQLTGQTFLQVRVDPQAIARYGVPTRNVLNVVEAVGSPRVGEVREGQRRFPLVVRLPDRQRTDPDALAATLIPTAAGRCCL